MKTASAGLLAVLMLCGTAPAPASAQEAAFPSRPVKIVVAFPVGGLLDTVSRVVGDKLSALLGQQFIIESRPGAGGTLATGAVARAEPDGYTLMIGELFAAMAGGGMLHVPFRGGAPALNDLVAGHLDTMFLTAVVGMQQMKAGRLTPLAIAVPARFELLLPDVATMAEVGYPLEAAYWFGLAAPAGTPPAILAKLEKALAEILAMPDLRRRMTDMGAVVTPLGSKEFGNYIQAEMRKWSDVIAQNKITVQQ
jgi:tripartite-type tricarboxylate transporter receptor subunit TctC